MSLLLINISKQRTKERHNTGMKDLSLYVLDLVQNSLRAEAKYVSILVKDSISKDLLEIIIEDNGHGMDSELLAKVTNPFVTTRTTREFGMGIPFFQMAAQLSGGTFQIDSTLGHGTTLRGVFVRSHINILPLGDMTETMVTLIQGAPDVDFLYCYETDSQLLKFDTKEIREILEDVPLNMPDVLGWIRDYLKELKLFIEPGH